MKYLNEFSQHNQGISYSEFEKNINKKDSFLENILSEIPVFLILKAKKEISNLNIKSILKKIYDYIIGKKEESVSDYIFGFYGLHSVITLAKWFKDFAGTKIYKYFLQLIGLDSESVDDGEFAALKVMGKLFLSITFIVVLCIRICWVSGVSSDTIYCSGGNSYNLRVYYSSDKDKIIDDFNNTYTLDGNAIYNSKDKLIGYISDGQITNVKGGYVAIQSTASEVQKLNLESLIRKSNDPKVGELNREIVRLDSLSNVVRKEKDKFLSENVDQAKALLRELKLDPNDSNFLDIKEMLKDNLGYCGLFTKFFFKDRISLFKLKELYDKIKQNNSKLRLLPKNIVEYTSFESLDDDLSRLDETVFSNKIWNMLPREQKDMFEDINARSEISYDSLRYIQGQNYLRKKEKIKFTELAKQLSGKEELINQFKMKISAYKSAEAITTYLKNLIDSESKNYDSILNKCKSLSGVKIRYENKEKKILIVRVSNWKSMKDLGSDTNWCIVRDKSYFDMYTENGEQQLMLFDFKRDFTDPLSVIGITVNTNNNIRAIHDKRDSSIGNTLKDHKFYDKLELTHKEFFELIKYRIDYAKERVLKVLNNKYVKKFLDAY